MKRMLSFAAVLGAGLLLFLAPTPVLATCSGISQPFFHAGAGVFDDCTDLNQVGGYAFVSGQETTNSSQILIACNEAGTILQPQLLVCQATAGTAGDNRVTINFNWGNSGPIDGCPNGAGAPGVGRNSVVMVDNDGHSAVVEVGYDQVTGGYLLEQASDGAETDANGNPFCNPGGSPQWLRDTDLGGGSREVCVAPQVPPIFSDCDAGAVGAQGGTGRQTCVAPGDTEASWTVSDVYWQIAPCNTSVNPDLVEGTWSGPIAVVAGEACVPYTAPLAVDECILVATSAVVSEQPGPVGSCLASVSFPFCSNCPTGVATDCPCATDADCGISVVGDSVTGWTQVAGNPLAAADRAVAVLAALGKGNLQVKFNVSLEQDARSFDILAAGRVINDSPILAENRGTYVASINKAGGKLKGAKEITVRTNLDGGGTLMSEPLTIKKGNK